MCKKELPFLKTRSLVIACAAAVVAVSALLAVKIDTPVSDKDIAPDSEYVESIPVESSISWSEDDFSVPVNDTDEVSASSTDLSYSDEDYPARQIDFYTLVEGIFTTAPTDGSYYSVQHFEADAKMELVTEDEIASLYLVWNSLPGSFDVSVDGTVYHFEGNTFLHQYIRLPEPGTHVTVVTPDWGTELCDIYAFSRGTPPDWVQRWRTLSEGEHADILLFPTHADDEYLFFGGIIPLYAGERGLNVQVVYMNRHVGYDWNRNHELLNGLWAAGTDICPVINPQDDAMLGSLNATADFYGYDNFTGFQVEQIRKFKPSVIVGHAFNGEYGHKTHIFNANCLADAVELAADSDSYTDSAEKYGVWDTPKFYVHLYKENSITLDYETPLESFGGLTAAEAAAQAYGYHYSQHIWYSGIYLRGAYDSHLFGLYRSVVGEDIAGGDIMENISGNPGGTE